MTGVLIPWGKIEFSNSELILPLNGPQSVQIKKCNNELIITKVNNEEAVESRFITGNEHNVYIEPGLPDLPIILKPTQDISILPGKKLEVYIEIPFVIRIFHGAKQKRVDLTEIELNPLSRSFFGNSESGEFAYFLESPMNCSISDYSEQDTSIYCPLTINNKSPQKLEFEKMIFRAPYLSIYGSKDLLTANPVNITFRGQEQISQIDYKKSPNRTEEGSTLLSQPRLTEDKNLIKRSFYFIKNLYTG